MKIHHTKNKADIGLSQMIADLTRNGYSVSLPLSEHLSYDLIYDDGIKLRKLQVKYRHNGKISNRLSYSTSKGCVSHKYSFKDFDMYGLYLPNKNACVYVPNIENKEDTFIRTEYPKNNYPFYWWEDFLDAKATELPRKRKLSEFDPEYLLILIRSKSSNVDNRKIKNRPSIDILKNDVDLLGFVGAGKKYGVSDNAIRKWLKKENALVV